MNLSGYRLIHETRGLWSADEDISVPWVIHFMMKIRCLVVLWDVHLADNMSMDSSDPHYKERDYFKFFNMNFKEAP